MNPSAADVRGSAGDSAARIYRWLVPTLLLIGGVVIPVIGWVVGVVLLWRRSEWSLRQKVAATLLLPGGWLPFVYAATARVLEELCTPAGCTGPSAARVAFEKALLGLSFVLPLIGVGQLSGRRAVRGPGVSGTPAAGIGVTPKP